MRDLLDPVGKKLGLDGAVDAGRLFERWEEIVGQDVAAHVEPTSLRAGTLRVRTDSPAWATEVSYLSADITRRLNAALGKEVVVELKVSSGPRTEGKRVRASVPPRQATDDPGAPSQDPREAFEKARRAWAEQQQKRGSDQEF
jgi:predicted nucleic acid-binding Zn ribbon protein